MKKACKKYCNTVDKINKIVVLYKLSLGDINGEVVELVYGTSLENWRRFVAYRGFESHPLRHFFIKNMEQYPRG